MDIEHHLGHAAASYLTSAWDSAATIVLDLEPPGLSVWMGEGATLSRHEWTWRGQGSPRSIRARRHALGFHGSDQGQRFDAVARLMPDVRDDRVDRLLDLEEDGIRTAPDWLATLETLRSGAILASPASQALASSVQARFGDLLLGMLHRVRRDTGQRRACLAGSLFYSSFFSSLAKRSRIFDEVFVPVNPGNAGLSVGTALLATGAAPRTSSPFLGPAFSADEVKATLDNCKLRYEWLSEGEVIDRTVAALSRGYLVGWFDGAMEWGPRALGARSILASPFSEYVLENLNRFLKHRAPWRSYALSGLDDDVARLFDGPASSPYMECDYRTRDPELFRHVLPHPHGGAADSDRRARSPAAVHGAPAGVQAGHRERRPREHVVQRFFRADRLHRTRRGARVLRHRAGHARDRPLRAHQIDEPRSLRMRSRRSCSR